MLPQARILKHIRSHPHLRTRNQANILFCATTSYARQTRMASANVILNCTNLTSPMYPVSRMQGVPPFKSEQNVPCGEICPQTSSYYHSEAGQERAGRDFCCHDVSVFHTCTWKQELRKPASICCTQNRTRF